MKTNLPFPDGHDRSIERDIIVESRGRKIRVKGITEDDVREIREILIKEIKRQKEEDDK